jgi:5'(3')-deoxyribonucleotidase
MVLKIDVDGVIRNIISTMIELYNKQFEENLTVSDIKDYNVNVSFPKCLSENSELASDFFFVDNAESVFLNSSPCNGAKDAIDMLHRAGHKVIICTWQNTFESKLFTLEFLEKNKIYYDDICFLKDKSLIKSDLIVDDNPEFLDKDNSDKKICIEAPYNKDYTCEKFDSLYSFVIHFLGI